MTAALGEIGLTRAQFLARIPEAERAGGVQRYEGDYALTRIVLLNCAAVGAHSDKANPTDLVVKGGFAIRHLYQGVRYSKDADLSMWSDELELEGPQLMRYPTDMEAGEPRIGDAGESWFIPVSYRRTDRTAGKTRIDLNDRSRALRRRPPQKRALSSLFVDPIDVWAATTEEIVGEKLFALMDKMPTRVKDVFDIRHVLALPLEEIDAGETRRVYQANRSGKGNRTPRIADLPRTLRAGIGTAAAQEAWRADVLEFVDGAPSLAVATAEMLDLLNERVLRG